MWVSNLKIQVFNTGRSPKPILDRQALVNRQIFQITQKWHQPPKPMDKNHTRFKKFMHLKKGHKKIMIVSIYHTSGEARQSA